MSDEVRHYNQFEYCKACGCNRLVGKNTQEERIQCKISTNDRCPKSAKQFHAWLKNNGFLIVKKVEDDD